MKNFILTFNCFSNFWLFNNILVSLVSRDCCVALPRGAMSLSEVCDSGISPSYSLIVLFRRRSLYGFGTHVI